MPREFVVQLDSHPGELAHLARALAARGIELTHISCAGSGRLECMFVTTGDDEATREVLRGLGHAFIEGNPILVDVPEGPGLVAVTERLARAGVRVTGILPVGCRPGVTVMAFCVDDEERARAALDLPEALNVVRAG